MKPALLTGLSLVVCSFAGVGVGCGGDASFQCQNDNQCVSSGVTGVCQSSGYCSFVDAGCETGFRYADSAPPGLAGQCVEPGDVGSTGTTTSQPSTMSSTGTPSTDGATVSSTMPGSSTETESTLGSSTQAAESSSTDGSSTSEGSSSQGSSSSGGITCPEFADEFDNGVVEEAPWTQFSGKAPIISESGGRLRFAIEPGTDTFEFIEMSDVDITNGYAVAHLVSLPQDDAAQFLLRVFPDDDPNAAVELLVTSNTELVARVDGDLLQFVDLGLGTTELWLEVVFAAGVASFSYSVDGQEYIFIGSSAVVGDYSVADVSLMGGSFEATTAPLHVIEVDDFEFCTQPFE